MERAARAAYRRTMPAGTPLSRYLRARRALVRPEDVGIMPGGRRRVSGLRREELALLAGISPNYYLRLEQGRDRHPSAQVLDALARALRLDAGATSFLHSLASAAPDPRPHDAPEPAPASIQRLIGTWPGTPAVVHDRRLDILAANALATALSPAFRPGANALRVLFLDPEMRDRYVDWEEAARTAVARLRTLAGREADGPRFCELAGELSARSADFRRMWSRQDIQSTGARPFVYDHPVVGRLELQPEMLAIMGTDGQILYLRHAAPGSVSELRLKRLAALAEPVPVRGGDDRALANRG
jgi:transcriptional regulator with XRE-family HTH domain